MTRRVPLLAAVAAVVLVALYAGAARTGGGTYNLPNGDVTTGSTITSTWANSTLHDIRDEITNSLDRQGRGAMLASLQLYSGVVASPGLNFSAEPTSGLYRNAAGDIRMSVLSNSIEAWSTAGVGITGTLSTTGLATLASAKVTGNLDAITISPTGANTTGAIIAGSGTGGGATISSGPSGGVAVQALCVSGGNCNGVIGLGTGISAGLSGTGGNTSGAGVTGQGGTGGVGGSFTGSGAVGVLAQGGANSHGVQATGAGTGAGVYATGGATGPGGSFAPGTAATSTVRADAVLARNGDINLDGVTNPLNTTALKNRLTPKNITKAWAYITVNGTTASVLDALSVTSASAASGNTIVVTWATPFTTSNYLVLVSGNSQCIPTVISQNTTTATIKFWVAGNNGVALTFCSNGGVAPELQWNGVGVHVLAEGVQ